MDERYTIGPPVRGSLKPVYWLSVLIAVLMASASAAGILFPSAVYPAEDLIKTFAANDYVNLFIGLPVLLVSMLLTRRGSLTGLLCWPGALFFVLYNYLAYVFAMPLNAAFPAHLTLVTASLYTLILLVSRIDGESVKGRIGGTVPTRLPGGILAGLGLLFFTRVIVVIGQALSGGSIPPDAEFAVNISDFLTAPAWVFGGILLWRRREFGYVAGLGLLYQGSMLFLGLIAFLLLQPFLTGAPFAVADILVIVIMGMVCFIPFVLFIRGVRAARQDGS